MFTTSPSSILLHLGPVTVHWYGVLVVAGFLAGLGVLLYLFKNYGFKKEEAYDLFFYVIIFGLLGARLYYVAYAWSYYSENWLDIPKIWQGGLAIHGAIIGAFLTIYFYSQRKKWPVWLITDMVATILPLSLAIGRWGNYFNQELFGKPTNLPWGIPIDLANRPEGYTDFVYFHPTFLYESLLDLVLFLVLFRWQKKRFKIENPSPQSTVRSPQSQIQQGGITLLFLFGYSAIRFSMEFLRTDYSPEIWGLRWAQVLSVVVMGGVAIAFLVLKIRKGQRVN
jgi:phosphatidylglycerol:prolipoprotein diacylglycerol transferase